MKTMFELLQYAYPDDTDEAILTTISRAKAGEINVGIIWERICRQYLGFEKLRPNTAWRDHEDFSDSKFAKVVRINNFRNSPNCRQATINTKNKIGELRVCLWDPITDKLYYMLIPYEYYIQFKGHPIKITFQDFNPKGKHWDQYQCNFDTVVGTVANKSKEVYNTNIRILNGKFISQA
jgi:hypothetical protein